MFEHQFKYHQLYERYDLFIFLSRCKQWTTTFFFLLQPKTLTAAIIATTKKKHLICSSRYAKINKLNETLAKCASTIFFSLYGRLWCCFMMETLNLTLHWWMVYVIWSKEAKTWQANKNKRVLLYWLTISLKQTTWTRCKPCSKHENIAFFYWINISQ